MITIDSWYGGASGLRLIHYRVIFTTDYFLQYQVEGVTDWMQVDRDDYSETHRVARGIAFMVIVEEVRKGKNERMLA